VSERIFHYFPALSDIQKERLSHLKEIYDRWNSMINVISRKDMDNFHVHHVLHSLSIAKAITFLPGTRILDAGTGGGFPGIPLAILFPDCEFTLLDSIEKKIKVVGAVAEELGLENVVPVRKRLEEEKDKFDFVVSRAVTGFPGFVSLASKNIRKGTANSLENGIIYLKGGDLKEELSLFSEKIKVWPIGGFFSETFFETKVIVYLPL
jgi:16S rRNA (guanine527-N7)-methyltransferase